MFRVPGWIKERYAGKNTKRYNWFRMYNFKEYTVC